MEKISSMQRILTALTHKEGDRVPFILPLTLHGAKELVMSIKEYFSSADNVYKGQIILKEKYDHDAYIGFLHAPLEIAAFGGEVIYVEDGPPNSGEPVIKCAKDILTLEVPDVKNNKHTRLTLDTISKLKEVATDQTPIIGVVMSPFSLPVMQMGFDKYLDLIYEDRELFWKLMEKNLDFAKSWANAQVEAGAAAIVYFDPVSSPTIIPTELYKETGLKVAQQFVPKVNAGVVSHFASGSCLPILDDVIGYGSAGVGVSSKEDLEELKKRSTGKITLLGNLNAIEMRNWDIETTKEKVKEIINIAGKNGGLILMDNHGEIPWQVSDEILFAIADAVKTYGKYPLGE